MTALALVGYMVAAVNNGDVWYMVMFGGITLMGVVQFGLKPT